MPTNWRSIARSKTTLTADGYWSLPLPSGRGSDRVANSHPTRERQRGVASSFFFTIVAPIVLLISLLLAFLSSSIRYESPPSLPYEVDRGWPQLPNGWTLGQGSSIAADSQGHVYAVHRGAHPVLCFNRDGKLLRSWGDGLFCWPHGIRVDSDDNVWITDGGTGWWPTPNAIPGKGHVVLKFKPEGRLLMTIGEQGKPGDDESHLNGPSDVAFAPNGDFYVTDGYGNSRVVKFSRNGKYLLSWGKKGGAEGEFNLPHAIAIDSGGKVYVADRENLRVQIFDQNGKFLSQWKHTGRPIGLALGPDGQIYVADANRQKILKVSPEGRIQGEFGVAGQNIGEFAGVHHIRIATSGELYVAELTAQRFQKFVSVVSRRDAKPAKIR